MKNKRQIDLGEDFGDVVIKANGVTVQITGAGAVMTDSQALSIQPPAAANDDMASGNNPAPLRESSDIGNLVKGKGIYLGTWEPKDNSGRTLGKIFDIYAAPGDIRNGRGNLLRTFNDTVKHVADLRNYHGHDGGNFANEKAVLEAVRNNPEALAKWFIPTKELLHGKTSGGDKIQLANLYDSRNTGTFKNTFITKSDFGNAHGYLSLTEPPNYPFYVCIANFADGAIQWVRKDGAELSSRVGRAELRPEPPRRPGAAGCRKAAGR